jgi:hypothetical protein
MFGIWRTRKPEVLDHQATYLEDFSISPGDLYKAIEGEIAERKMPDIDMSRAYFREGGLLTANREYLNIRRERFAYLVCAAPWGTSFFFSTRFTEIPRSLRWWELIVAVIALGALFVGYWQLLGLIWGIGIFLLNVISAVVLCRNLVAMGWNRLDDLLMRLPVFGVIYECYLRPSTFYRDDTRGLFKNLVQTIVHRQIGSFTSSSGLKLLEFKDLKPEPPLAAFLRKTFGG